MTFIESIYEKAKADKRTIAIPESTNEVMLRTAVKVQADGICQIVLVGDPAAIQNKAQELGLDLSGIRIADVADEDFKNQLLDTYEQSPKKVMGRKFVAKRIGDPLYLATLMEAVGEVDATIAGIDTTTYEFVLAANSIIGMAPGCETASGLQILELEEGPLAPVACLAADPKDCPRAAECRTLPMWAEYDQLKRDFFFGKKLSDLVHAPGR